MKHLWQVGQRKVAFDTLSKFVRTQSKSVYVDDEEAEGDKLLARYVCVSESLKICIGTGSSGVTDWLYKCFFV